MNRREFLNTTLMAGAGAYVLGQASARAQEKTDVINLAIIGVGSQGKTLLNAAKDIPNISFKAVCDIWEYARTYGERWLQKYGHKPNAYENYQDMLEKEKDLHAVIVASPDFMHAEHANASMKAGKHVYCEKMMSNDIEKARSIVKTMQETGKLCQIGHQRRSNPRYLHALNNLMGKAKLFGRIVNVNGQWNRSVSDELGWPEKYTIPADVLKKYGYEDMRQFRNWRWFKKYGGGPISDLGAHQIDIFNWFLGAHPKSVMASGGTDYYKNLEWYDNVMAIYEYDTPEGVVRAFYQVLTATGAGGGYYESFMGDQGSLKMSESAGVTKIYREARAPEWKQWIQQGLIKLDAPAAAPSGGGGVTDARESAPPEAYSIPVVLDKPYHTPHIENFLDAIRGKGKLNCPADEAFASEAAVFKVTEAVVARKALDFTPEDFKA